MKHFRVGPAAGTAFLFVTLAVLTAGMTPAQAQPPCEQFGTGGSTPYLPPGCKYHSPADIKDMKDTTAAAELIAKPIHQFFVCLESPGGANSKDCRQRGGSLGGNQEQFTSEVVLQVEGQGSLAGFQRTVVLNNVYVEVHSGPDAPGSPVQDFPTEMMALQGSLPPGDPDFDELTIVGGTSNGHPSPGHFHADYDPARDAWKIDSHFDVEYSIRFRGAPGSPLEGFAGTTDGVTHMVAVGQ
jgi:hypothetical protein